MMYNTKKHTEDIGHNPELPACFMQPLHTLQTFNKYTNLPFIGHVEPTEQLWPQYVAELGIIIVPIII